MAGDQPCWGGSWGPGGHQAEHESAEHFCTNKSHSLLNLQEHDDQSKSHDHPAVLSTLQAAPRVLCLLLVPIIQERCWETRGAPQDNLEYDQRTGRPALWGKIEGVRSFLSGEEIAYKEVITVFQYLKHSYRENRGSFFTKSDMEKTGSNRTGFISSQKRH